MSSTTIGAILLSNFHERVEEKIAEYKSWYLLQAVAFIAAGIVAMLLPVAAATEFAPVLGAVLLVSGLLKAFVSVKSHLHWWSLLSSAVSISVGSLLLWQPLPGAHGFAILLAVFLLSEGFTEMFLAFEYESATNWGWLLLAGFVSVLFSLVLFFGWSGISTGAMTIMIGLNLLMYGGALLALSAPIRTLETL